ncbi:hypothetical protein ACFRAE_01015 [Sphingobacterium sp. HJSM2_6]|uniref:hypothetical protein n=1 Tax=Sphingobacterium sp. HJSM2_6 TaxID=3366264 RepID=UPI003BCDF5AA
MSTQVFKFQIAAPAIHLSKLEQDPNRLLSYLPEETLSALKSYIFDQLQNKDGAPMLSEMNVTRFEYQEAYHTGRFRIAFKIDRQFCCADTLACASDYMDFSFRSEPTQLLAEGSFFDWTLDN